MYEIRVRYIHHEGDLKNWQVTFESGSTKNTLTMEVSEGFNTSVVEVMENSIVTQLRLKNISHNFVGPSFFDEYPYIQILQVDCPIPSISWIFRKLPAFKFLTEVHLTKEAFRESIEGIPSHKTWMTCPNVHTFQVEYDPYLYAESEPMDRKRWEIRLTSALRFGQIMFPNLKQCRLLVPIELEKTLDGFIDSYPNVRLRGEKLIRYVDGSVCFSNLDCDLSLSTRTQTQRRASAPPGDVTSTTSYTDGYNRWLQEAKSKERLLSPVPLADAPIRTYSASALEVGSEMPRKTSMPLPLCSANLLGPAPGASQLAVRSATPTVRITTLL